MQFSKASEQNAWDAVSATTLSVRSGDKIPPQLLSWFKDKGINMEDAIFPAVQPVDDNVYAGTLINQERRVLEYFVDLDELEDGELDDVTLELGPKDPAHPAHDLKDLITMALVYFDQQQKQAA